eukprot:TRINITY_DN19639_c0_g2_i5.p1 TRINITY_DN19639_c0_g2~~TRINITY_DN19639_c0_g2_i5.p1  ORF type:complete len:332 (-),score=73.32 TRINITY_DN19639_c0_g2_i5:157-1152(-)
MHQSESGSENRLVVYRAGDRQIMTVVLPDRQAVGSHKSSSPKPNTMFCPTCGSMGYSGSHQAPEPRTSYVHPEYFLTLGDAAHGTASEYFNLARSAFNASYYKRFFREEKKIGGGAYGSVFLCQHVIDSLELGQYAIKKVPVGDDRGWLKQKLGEVRALERITQHPNIIQYHHAWLEWAKTVDFGPEVPTMFVLMQYANGGSLHDKLWGDLLVPPVRVAEASHVPMPEEEVWWCLHSIAAGLHHLHTHSILHNDLKPANILLGYDDWRPGVHAPNILLSDFGESIQIGAGEAEGRSGGTGTLGFMAPELFLTNDQGVYTCLLYTSPSPRDS